MSEKLRVELVAEVQKFQKGLKQAEKKLLQFDKSTGKGAKGLDKLGKSSVNAVPAVNEFSRVIQDMPFGIQGVANNITQLTQSFGYLQKSTGSSKEAFKAMLSTLAGPAGILLAVSTVTSLMVSFGDQLFKTKDKAKSLKEEQEKLNEALDNYVLGLEATKQASLKGTQAAQKELVTLRALRSQAENTNLSYKERIAAVNELQKKYPNYFANVDKEKILNGELKGSYDLLSKSILKRARSTAAMNAIVKNSEQILVLEDKIAAKQVERAKLADRLRMVEKKLNAAVESGATDSFDYLTIAVQKAKNRLNDFDKGVNQLQGSLQNLELTNIDLEGKIETALTGGAGGNGEGATSPIAEAVLKPFENIGELTKLKLKPFNDAIRETFAQTPIIVGESAQTIKASLLELNNSINELAMNSLMPALANIGQAIGTSLVSGGNVFAAIGKSLLQSFGQFMQKMGALLIEYGVLAKAKGKLDLAIVAGGPAAIAAGGAAIGVGIALVAAGAALSAAASGGFGGGATNTSTSTQTSSGGSFTSGFSGSGGGTVVFEIAGTKLVGVLSNTLRQNRNLGGTLKFD